MRKLIVATAALLAGTALAAAQVTGPGGQGGGAGMGNRTEGSSPAPAQQRNAPAEKMDQGQRSNGAQMKAPETSGQAQREPGAAPKAGDAGRQGQAQDDKKDDKKPGATTGQGAGGQRSTSEQKPSGDMGRSSTDRPAAGERAGQGSGDTRQGATTGQGAAGARGSVNLTTEQRTQIRTVVKEKVKVQPVTNVNFSVSVGTKVPRDVRYVPVPQEIITIYPQWRGYYLIVVNEQIVIIEPSSFEIVAVIV